MKDTADVKRNKPSVADCSCCVTQSETRLAATGKEIVSAVVGYNDISVAEGYEIMSTVVGEHGIVSADGTNSTASAIGYSSLSFASGKSGISTATAGLSMAVNASTLGIAASTGNVGNAYFSSYTGEFADGSWYNVLSVFGYNAMSDTVTVAMPYVSEVLRRRHSKQDKPQEMDFVQLTEEEIQRMQAKMFAREMSNI